MEGFHDIHCKIYKNIFVSELTGLIKVMLLGPKLVWSLALYHLKIFLNLPFLLLLWTIPNSIFKFQYIFISRNVLFRLGVNESY